MVTKKTTVLKKDESKVAKEKVTSYYLLKIRWVCFPRLLNRTVLFRTNGSFVQLDRVMRFVIGADTDHLSCFEDESGTIASFTGFGIDKEDDVCDNSYAKKTLKWVSLNSKDEFFYTYDFGDNYRFRIKVEYETVEKPGNELAYVIKGKGQGIWEDEIGALYDLLSGGKVEEDEEEYSDRAKSIEEFAIDIEPYVYDDSLL